MMYMYMYMYTVPVYTYVYIHVYYLDEEVGRISSSVIARAAFGAGRTIEKNRRDASRPPQ